MASFIHIRDYFKQQRNRLTNRNGATSRDENLAGTNQKDAFNLKPSIFLTGGT